MQFTHSASPSALKLFTNSLNEWYCFSCLFVVVYLSTAIGLFHLGNFTLGDPWDWQRVQTVAQCCPKKGLLLVRGVRMWLYANLTFLYSDDHSTIFWPLSLSLSSLSALLNWLWLLQPAAVVGGLGGLVYFLHYNDERRAIPKGVSYFHLRIWFSNWEFWYWNSSLSCLNHILPYFFSLPTLHKPWWLVWLSCILLHRQRIALKRGT